MARVTVKQEPCDITYPTIKQELDERRDGNGIEPLQPVVKTENIKVEVKDEIDIFEEEIELKTGCQPAAASDAHSSNNQELSYSAVKTTSRDEPPETKVECYSQENDRVKNDCIPSDSGMSESYLSERDLVCKLCNVTSTDCKCRQRCEFLYLSAERVDDTGELPNNSPSPQCSDKYVCDLCGIPYVEKSDLIQHILMHGQKQTLPWNMGEKSFICKSNLISHKTHSRVRLFYCELCSKSFREKKCLVVHIRTHSGERPFSCNLCSKSFRQKSHLIQHSSIHSGERPFNCDMCNKSFRFKRGLNRHRNSHSEERPLSCDLCSTSFRQKSHLIEHSRIHSGERPFNCLLCSKSFRVKNHLIEHSRIHSGERPFNCDLCSKSFRLKNHLIGHSRIHSGERPFNCDLCSKSFRQKNSLIGHRKIHSRERSYSCEVCNKLFSLNKGLIRHRKTHSLKNPFTLTTSGLSNSLQYFNYKEENH